VPLILVGHDEAWTIRGAMPASAGIHVDLRRAELDSRLRGNDVTAESGMWPPQGGLRICMET